MLLIYRSVITKSKFDLLQKWKCENGGMIASFDEILNIKGISKKTVDGLRIYCESQLHTETQRSNVKAVETYPQFPFGGLQYEDISALNYEEKPFDESMTPQHFVQNASNTHNAKNKAAKSLKLVLDPHLTQIKSIRSFTAIHQCAEVISYTKLSVNVEWASGVKVENWGLQKSPAVGSKFLCDMSERLSTIVDQLPESDIYIVDDHIKSQNYYRSLTPKMVSDIVAMNQQCAILVSLLQQRKSKFCAETRDPNVVFMSYNIVAKLYNLLVGREIASTQPPVRTILNNKAEIHISKNANEIIGTFGIEMENSFKNTYFKSYPLAREQLGKSLLLGLTFVRLGLLDENKTTK